MSRIVRFHQTGGPEVLKIEEAEVPAPGKGEVRIQVKALGLNRAEAMFRSGKYLQSPKFPARIGYEASGIVESIGPDVKNLSPGDVVSVAPPPDMNKYGVYGEMAIVPARYVIKHPQALNFVEAAAIWMQYLTAYGALFDIAKLTKGDYIVIPAASSSVGIAAIQLANLVGAIPIATTRTSQKKKMIEEAGAKHVIATQEENLADKLHEATKGQGARIVFDPVGGKTVLDLAKGMAAGGLLIEYGALSPEPTPFPLLDALMKGLTMRGYTLFELLSNQERMERAIKFISEGLESKKLKPIIAKTFKLEEIVDAHRYLESNQQFGKIVVTV
ncbi:zinc-dependent alcohol dehydrogenase family protein [Candidatus Protochlamydia phocaeensis]|uniref:zinc-dependent alcohol dehydrogenase family protein n=1 Tax=Candidatus Protochlamydia phocaeensis TaxID=1414722 RepID=UPI000839562E|nr:zinc-dependent alcohol dehydrogenase family protein [Candidatus Protochlamydia phocaeensis]